MVISIVRQVRQNFNYALRPVRGDLPAGHQARREHR
jgi:hypothetical protein